MKKSAKNRIIIWSVVSVILIGVLVSGMTLFNHFTFGKIQIGVFEIGTDFSKFERGNAEFDYNDIKNLHVNWTSGNVNIKKSTTDKIKIYEDTVSKNNKMYYKLADNGTLEIYDRKNFTLIGIDFGRNNKNLTVEIPSKAVLFDTEVSAASANIEVTGCSSQDMKLGTVSGKIELSDIKGTNLELSTTSGTVTTDKCDYLNIMTNSVSGGITVNTYATCGHFKANSVSGRVAVFFNDIYENSKLVDCKLKNIEVDSVSGGVELNLPTKIEGFTADLESVSGAKIVNFNGTQYDNKTVYGNGKTDIDVETVSGSIKINKVNRID